MLQSTKNHFRGWPHLLLCAVLLYLLHPTAYAVSAIGAQLRPDITIIIDNAEQTFYNANGQEVHPVLCGGTTYLPVRAIGEVMGKNVDWNQTARTVTLAGNRSTPATAGTPDADPKTQDITVEIRDDFTIVVDGAAQTFRDASGSRVYPLLYNGSTYLPLRAIGELMGKTVNWDGAARTVTMSGGISNSDGNLVTDADSFSTGTVPSANGTNAGLITVEEAKAAALKHANLTASQVTFVKQKLDYDDGRQVYDIEFRTGDYGNYGDYKEYDCKIDAQTGAVLEFDYDAGSGAPPASSPETGNGSVSQDKAREIALSKVPGATVKNVTKLKTDRDNGQLIYEVEIVYNGMEYEFEISAADGKILEMESEPVDD